MYFEFDPNKNELNKIKHGIDFIKAQELWNDPEILKIATRTTDEERNLII